jgi:hypothetical protein
VNKAKILLTKRFWSWQWNDFKTNMKKPIRQNLAEGNPEYLWQTIPIAIALGTICTVLGIVLLG